MKYIKPNWPAPTHIKAYTTVRNSWGHYTPHHAIDPETGDREDYHLKTLLNLPESPIWTKQTHSAIALEALPSNQAQIADATYTNKANRVCAVLTADCLPLLVCNRQGTHVAAIHAGWRGLASGIIESTLARISQPADDLLVWLGPAIGPSKFEVGKDVYDAFTSVHAESALAFTAYREGKWLANIYELAKVRLKLLGVFNIFGGDHCTFSQPDLFFSYRRDQGKTGRMVSLIWIAENSC